MLYPAELQADKNGVPERTRTSNLQIRNLLLYTIELRKQTRQNGVPEGTRTPNLQIRSLALYPVELQEQDHNTMQRHYIIQNDQEDHIE